MSDDNESAHQRDVAFIEALARLLRERDLTEIEVKRDYAEDDTLRVRLSRGAPVHAVPAMVSSPAASPVPAAPAPAPAQSEAPPSSSSGNDPAQHPGAVTSPMVGTAYLSPEPGASPFVGVGDKVSEGQTLMIVEAMKTMNPIPAPKAGTVSRVLVGDGDPVEFGAPLMIVE